MQTRERAHFARSVFPFLKKKKKKKASALQADTESHAESHSSDVASVPWLCFVITLIE